MWHGVPQILPRHLLTHSYFPLRPSMQRYDIKEGKKGNAIYRGKNYGPTFGSAGGHDIHIASSALSSTSSYTNGGHSYNFPSVPNYQLNDGVKNFKVKEDVKEGHKQAVQAV